MPDEDTNTTPAPAEPETPAEEAQPEAAPETAAPVEEQATEAPAEEAPEAEQPSEPEAAPAEDIDLDKYWQERYQAPASTQESSQVAEVAKELAQLPADADGTVDANAAAEWFANKLNSTKQEARVEAQAIAEKAAMGIVSESAQQQLLIKKYPDLVKDKEQLDTVFDLRDASAMRGQNLTLMQAAEKLAKLTRQAKNEGAKSASRTTTIQAAAHLETSSVKGDQGSGDRERLAITAVSGFGNEAKTARRELLKQFVQREVEEGRIQHP